MPYDEKKAEKAVKFIERLRFTKGKWYGRRFKLLPWQDDITRKLFGTVDKKGLRQYRFVYCEIPKKNGKSEYAAAVALKCLFADGEKGGEVYICAGDRGQAGIIYNISLNMVKQNSTLVKRSHIIESQKRIAVESSVSVLAALSSESFTKHGVSPSCVVFDELHAQKNRDLYDTMTYGTDTAREQQIVLILTTAGVYDKNSIGWEVHEYARQVNDGIIEDETFLPVMYGMDPEKDDWKDKKVWAACNPSMGDIFNRKVLENDFKQARSNPHKINNFKRFRLNAWVNQISKYLPMEEWDACKGRLPSKKALFQRECYGGLDLSSSIDLTAFSLVFPPRTKKGKFITLLKFYVPEETIRERSEKDNVRYDFWVKAGLITATSGNVVDYDYIRRDVVKASKLYDLRQCAFDPWGAKQLSIQLDNEDGIEMIEHRQGFVSMSNPTKGLLVAVKQKKLIHGGNPVLRWCADNLAVKTDAAENVKPQKDKATDRIDGIVALIMALGLATLQVEQRSIYEKRGVITL